MVVVFCAKAEFIFLDISKEFGQVRVGRNLISGFGNSLHFAQMSSAAWRHILLNGHYTFQSGSKMIDLDTLLAGLDLK